MRPCAGQYSTAVQYAVQCSVGKHVASKKRTHGFRKQARPKEILFSRTINLHLEASRQLVVIDVITYTVNYNLQKGQRPEVQVHVHKCSHIIYSRANTTKTIPLFPHKFHKFPPRRLSSAANMVAKCIRLPQLRQPRPQLFDLLHPLIRVAQDPSKASVICHRGGR